MRNIRTDVDTEVTSLGINTVTEVTAFMRLPRRSGDMLTVIDAIKASLGLVHVSRRRIRHDVMRLFRNGQL